MGRPKLTRDFYSKPQLKYTLKRPKFTSQSFHDIKNECIVCGGTTFLHERPRPQTNYFYRTYGYKTTRVQWRIKCGNSKCYQPYGVILRPEEWDSGGE